MKKEKMGFTIVELLIVISIISVLSLLIVPNIVNYIKSGKDTYNDELKEQLLVAGKNYFSNNSNLLPKKTYLEVSTEKHSYVTLPELQSMNFVKNEFLDADDNTCLESYVLVSMPYGKIDNEWHSCLKCGNNNYSKDDNYCNITNWNDSTSPTCNVNNMNKKYNPENVTISDLSDDKGEISQIWIYNITTGKEKVVDVSNKTISQIKQLNIVDYLFGDGEYKISVRDEGGNFGNCSNESNRIIIDKTNPTCTLEYDKNTQKFKVESKDNMSNSLQTIVLDKNVSVLEAFNKIGITKPLKDGIYYGYVKDEAGNVNKCDKELDTKIEVKENEKPRCYIVSGNYELLTFSSKNASYRLECYLYKGENGEIDNNKITSKNNYGKIVITSGENNNSKNKIVRNIKYTANDEVDGYDNVIVNSGFVKSGSLLNDKLNAQKNDFKIYTKKPTCTVTKSNTNTTDGVTLTVNSPTATQYKFGSGSYSTSNKKTGVTSTTTVTVKDVYGQTGTCSVTVSSKKQYKSKTRTSTAYKGYWTYNYCDNKKEGTFYQDTSDTKLYYTKKTYTGSPLYSWDDLGSAQTGTVSGTTSAGVAIGYPAKSSTTCDSSTLGDLAYSSAKCIKCKRADAIAPECQYNKYGAYIKENLCVNYSYNKWKCTSSYGNYSSSSDIVASCTSSGTKGSSKTYVTCDKNVTVYKCYTLGSWKESEWVNTEPSNEYFKNSNPSTLKTTKTSTRTIYY